MQRIVVSKTEIKYMAVHVLAALIRVQGSDDDTLVARSLAITSKLNDAVDALPEPDPGLLITLSDDELNAAMAEHNKQTQKVTAAELPEKQPA